MDKELFVYNLRISSWIFRIWGALVSLKGFFDAAFGEPEANMFSPDKWDFISYNQWLRWSGFEITYGIFCFAFGYFLFELAKKESRGQNGRP